MMSQGVSMKRRKIDPETKMAAVLEGLRGESAIADICRKYQISESLCYRWLDKFLEGGSQALSSRNGSGPEAAVKARISELERIIGKQTVQIEAHHEFGKFIFPLALDLSGPAIDDKEPAVVLSSLPPGYCLLFTPLSGITILFTPR
jgi:transposase